MATSQAQKPNSGWDTRAWLLGLVGGNICAPLYSASLYPPTQRWLVRIGNAQFINVLGFVSALLGLLILPGLVSGLARRRPFLWGLLPLSCFWTWANVTEAAYWGWNALSDDFWTTTLACLGCLLASSGGVSLLRLRLRRRKEKRLRALAALEAQRQAAAIPQEGVWPPPPSYMGKEASDYRP